MKERPAAVDTLLARLAPLLGSRARTHDEALARVHGGRETAVAASGRHRRSEARVR